MTLEFAGHVWFWKGPAPFYFVTIPPAQSQELKEVLSLATYGWGMVPVNAHIGETEWYTALWPKDGLYILPLKTVIRKAEGIAEGDFVNGSIEVIFAGS